jgi:hypothetical protein
VLGLLTERAELELAALLEHGSWPAQRRLYYNRAGDDAMDRWGAFDDRLDSLVARTAGWRPEVALVNRGQAWTAAWLAGARV